MIYDDKCRFRHVEEYVKPNKKSKKGGAKGSVAILKESTQWGCVSQQSYPRKSILRKSGRLGSKHAVKFSGGARRRIGVRDGVRGSGLSRGFIQKCAPHERSPCAPKFEDRSHEETLTQERCARKAGWDLAKDVYKNSDKTAFYVPGEVRGMSTPITSKRPEEREFVVDSGASMHMISKKE